MMMMMIMIILSVEMNQKIEFPSSASILHDVMQNASVLINLPIKLIIILTKIKEMNVKMIIMRV